MLPVMPHVAVESHREISEIFRPGGARKFQDVVRWNQFSGAPEVPQGLSCWAPRPLLQNRVYAGFLLLPRVWGLRVYELLGFIRL